MERNELSQRVRLIPYVIAIENQLLSTAKRTGKSPPSSSYSLLYRSSQPLLQKKGQWLWRSHRRWETYISGFAPYGNPGRPRCVYESLPVPGRRVRCKQRKAFLSTPFGPVCEAVHMCHLHKSLHSFLRRHRRHTAGMSAPKSW